MPVDTPRLLINMDALAANYRTLKRAALGFEVAPVVKADAYGLGAVQVSERLWEEGARTFYVARLSEGEALRKAMGSKQADILVLDGAPLGSGPQLKAGGLVPVLNSLEQIERWRKEAGDAPLPAALHVDTGINRLGLTMAEVEMLAKRPDRLKGLEIGWVLSHLACADEPGNPLNPKQRLRFDDARFLFRGAKASLANSAGIFISPLYIFDQVRPGISLYGGDPTGQHGDLLQTVATLEAPILQVRDVAPGESIGYGGDFVATRPMKVAIIGAGYADGILRSTSKGGVVWYADGPRPVVGQVSMDLTAIDVTDVPQGEDFGDMVELIGPNLSLDAAAAAAGTTAYELLVRIGARAERTWKRFS
ncbi:MAG: alanine racemase [Caulobacter sp.]|nr:alanine racemase [Caulobacter sp.]